MICPDDPNDPKYDAMIDDVQRRLHEALFPGDLATFLAKSRFEQEIEGIIIVDALVTQLARMIAGTPEPEAEIEVIIKRLRQVVREQIEINKQILGDIAAKGQA